MKISLRRRHALMGEDGAFGHKMDYVEIFREIPDLEVHQNCTSYSNFANGLILSIGGASAVEGLLSTAPSLITPRSR